VAIVRVSGEHALHIARRLFRSLASPGTPSPSTSTSTSSTSAPPSTSSRAPALKSHRVYYGHVVDPADGRIVDEVLALPMRAPRSYTREDVVEFHTHGGGVCAQRVLQLCLEAGARRARPGEFTLRAFLNGRLDLSQAEAVQQLVSARTAAAADSALAGLEVRGRDGTTSEQYACCIALLL
jgi:tRNA modification GTPase